MNVRCQCGAVSFKTPTPEPIRVYHCHCVGCQRQSASAFGTSAIFPAAGLFPLSPELRDKLGYWNRPGPEDRSGDCYFCKQCGVRIMHRVRERDGSVRPSVSIKGGLVEGLDWSGAPHIFTREAVVPIPKGVLQYEGGPPA